MAITRTVTVREPRWVDRDPKTGMRFYVDGQRVGEFRHVFGRQDSWGSLQAKLEQLLPEPVHLTVARWDNDAVLYDLVTDNWVLEPRGHEVGPSITPQATMRARLDGLEERANSGLLPAERQMVLDQIAELRARMERAGFDPDFAIPDRWCSTHDKPVDGYGLCYRVDEDKPAQDCYVTGYMK